MFVIKKFFIACSGGLYMGNEKLSRLIVIRNVYMDHLSKNI